ncbi:cytochrome P450 3A31 [Xylariomycetidae sp. FL2044]|nr:cytochrome P450 3A31 [Xylariomycetidae sp. FL2044]
MAIHLILGAAICGLAATSIALIFKVIYLVFFHPLAKYPGPLLAKITPLYAAYHGWKGDIHIDAWRCHQKYGDHVRYGPNQLLFNSVEALKDIYSSGASPNFVKAEAYTPLIHRSPNILTIRGGKDHARRRRILAQGVSDKAQRDYETRIRVHINKLCEILFSSDKPVNMSDWCSYLLFDMMSDVVFGAKYNLLGSSEFRYVPGAINKSNVRMSTLMQFPALAKWKINNYLFPDAIAGRTDFVRFVSRVVKERLGVKKSSLDDQSTMDVFAKVEAAQDPETGKGFTMNEITAESTTLIVAGSDTTSTALATLLFYLAANKNAQEKAAAEVRAAFSSRDDIVISPALNSCTYLRACVDESLRITPPVGVPLWRRVVRVTTIDSQPMPPGCDVGMSIYPIHHDPRYFDRPFEYRPERWLADERSVERARAAFNPFSVGNRACLGKGLAVTEILLTVSTVLFEGNFRLAEGEAGKAGRGDPRGPHGRHREDEFQLRDYITGQVQGPVLQFTRREA